MNLTPASTVLAVALALGTPAAVFADTVTAWNSAALDSIRTNRTAPPIAARTLAILHIAMFDAVNGIARTHEPFFVESAVPASASREAAASAAAHRVLTALFPGDAAAFDELHQADRAAIPGSPHKARGLAWGAAVADRILVWRASDNSDALVSPPAGSGPGAWVPTPGVFAPYALPHWGFVAPFAMPAGTHFRPSGPPALDTQQYADEYNEVKQWGAAAGSSRTAEHDQIAQFWADGAGTETPPGHWNSIARDVADRAGHTLEQNARLFALLNAAMADAAICAWDAKYRFNFWRPVTAIRNGDSDGNPLTAGDSAWGSFIATPPFPDYVSGHSTFSGAAARVLALFFGTDRVAFSSRSDFLPGVVRHFSSFSAAAAEAAISRLYGGIHYRSANQDGLTAGLQIGEWTFTNFLRPKDSRSRK
jgi:hypothetical protein